MGTCDISGLDRADRSKKTEASQNVHVKIEVHVATNSICVTFSDEEDWPGMSLER